VTREGIAAFVASQERALAERNIAALTAPYAADCVVEGRLAGTVHGPAAVGQVYLALFAAFPDVAFVAEDLLIEGDRAVRLVRMSGTDTGGFMGLPATNKPFSVPIVVMYTWKDDLVVHERRVYDFTGLLVQIGVLKARPV
jgi:predicted ester cyclase